MFRSILFRVLLVSVAVYMIIMMPGLLPIWAELSIVIIYFGIYLVLKKKEKSFLRLIWDFAFINLMIYSRDIMNPLTFFFVLIPMINAVNFTGNKRHSLILMLLTILTIVFNKGLFEIWMIIPVLILFVLCALSLLHIREERLDNRITTKVDEYFLSPERLKSFEIYQSIINEINAYFKFSDDTGIKRIRVYSLKEDTLWLVNASSFMWERSIRLDSNEIDTLRSKKKITQKSAEGVSIFFYIPKYEIEYVFVCDFNGQENILYYVLGFQSMLIKAFSKMSMLLNTEYRIAQRREEKFNEIKDRVRYVNQAVRVMHFIRNKMTPLANVIAYHKMEDKMPVDVKYVMKKRFNKEVERADVDLKDILRYADYLLDESNSPFGELRVDEVAVSKVFILLSELAQSQLSIAVEADDNITSKKREEERVVHFNVINCKILFTDWIANMRKNEGYENKICMFMEQERLVVHFENTYSMTDEEAQRLVRDINSTGKDAVLEGKNYGHGLYYIKELARDYGIYLHANTGILNDRRQTIILELKFNTYERKENSNL